MNAPALRVLVIDDEPPIRKLLRMGLTTQGYDVLEASNGKTALDLATHKPDLIILDIQLPHISGLTLASEFKKNAKIKAIPIIAVTAFAMNEDEQKILDAGCEAYIAKPISIKHFIDTVQKYLGSGAAKLA